MWEGTFYIEIIWSFKMQIPEPESSTTRRLAVQLSIIC